jgi:hypothetical protein
MITCWHCNAESTPAHYERVVYNRTELFCEWQGWRLSGRFLIGPHGERFTPDRLAAIAHADKAKKRFGRMGNVLAFERSGNSTKQANE